MVKDVTKSVIKDATVTDEKLHEKVQKKLEAYRKKRNFNKTAEPSGNLGKGNDIDADITDAGATDVDSHVDIDTAIATTAATAKNQAFVIQEHHASMLHYDLRLEVDGVLKSWAVPKGLSINSKDKRLAVPTEDHPLAYKDFAGTIPAGEYGAGEVLIWDSGTYDNLRTVSMAQALDEGKVEVYLHGKKVDGKYAMIRMQHDQYTAKQTQHTEQTKHIKHTEQAQQVEQKKHAKIKPLPWLVFKMREK